MATTAPCRTATIRPAAAPPDSGTRRKDLDAVADALHPRRADEHGPHRVADDALELQVGLEGVDLTTEGVAAHRHVDRTEVLRVRSVSRISLARRIMPAQDP